jgi:hypothetical protein
MSSMLSAPATIPATNAATFTAGNAPPSAPTLTFAGLHQLVAVRQG